MTKLFSSIKIRNLEIKNRLWVSPMCMYSCEGQDGIVGQWHLVHLGSRAMGGAGMVIAEASAVSPEGRISPWCPGLYDDNQIAPWKVITDFIRGRVPQAEYSLLTLDVRAPPIDQHRVRVQ